MDSYLVLGHGATDGDGSFKLDSLLASSARFYCVYAFGRAPPPRAQASDA